ncbi:MAG TPA: glycosyltransferase family A protein [Chitinophagaceae bacterium]|nr:glycosyltransferase family A protein [Chitinophagaceae bacterium]
MQLIKRFFDLVVVIPLGPGCREEFICDSIESFLYYTATDHKIVLVDDSQKATGVKIKQRFPQADVLVTSQPMGKLCGLYLSLCSAYRYLLEQYRFRAVLRMDTDALVIGRHPEAAALQLFKEDPQTGMAGQYPLDYHGELWDTSWPRSQLLKIALTRYFFTNTRAHWSLLKLLRLALKNGYRTGESVFGGACFLSEACLQKLYRSGLLPRHELRTVELEEDHLFSILVRSVGFRLGDLSSDHLPMGCAWKGLPASPAELHAKGKKIIHSTRFWKQMNEAEIREWFRNKRETNINAV